MFRPNKMPALLKNEKSSLPKVEIIIEPFLKPEEKIGEDKNNTDKQKIFFNNMLKPKASEIEQLLKRLQAVNEGIQILDKTPRKVRAKIAVAAIEIALIGLFTILAYQTIQLMKESKVFKSICILTTLWLTYKLITLDSKLDITRPEGRRRLARVHSQQSELFDLSDGSLQNILKEKLAVAEIPFEKIIKQGKALSLDDIYNAFEWEYNQIVSSFLYKKHEAIIPFLMGNQSKNSPVYHSFFNHRLYDFHLAEEIFNYLPEFKSKKI